jgi:hypothetical protein
MSQLIAPPPIGRNQGVSSVWIIFITVLAVAAWMGVYAMYLWQDHLTKEQLKYKAERKKYAGLTRSAGSENDLWQTNVAGDAAVGAVREMLADSTHDTVAAFLESLETRKTTLEDVLKVRTLAATRAEDDLANARRVEQSRLTEARQGRDQADKRLAGAKAHMDDRKRWLQGERSQLEAGRKKEEDAKEDALVWTDRERKTLRNEIADLENTFNGLVDRLRKPVYFRHWPSGEVVASDSVSRRISINLGRKAGVVRGVVFLVYSYEKDGEFTIKGRAQVIEVGGATSVAIVTPEKGASPVKAGDLVENPLVRPDGAKLRVVVAGEAGGASPYDAAEVAELVRRWGGELEPTVNMKTNLLILGEGRGSDAEMLRGSRERTNAVELRRITIPMDDFVKYFTQP